MRRGWQRQGQSSAADRDQGLSERLGLIEFSGEHVMKKLLTRRRRPPRDNCGRFCRRCRFSALSGPPCPCVTGAATTWASPSAMRGGKFDPQGSTINDGYLIAARTSPPLTPLGHSEPQVRAASPEASRPATIGKRSNLVYGIEVGYASLSPGWDCDQWRARMLPLPDSFTFTTSINSNWLFTARPRIGFVSDNWLFYVTGGLAVTDLSATFLWGDTSGAAGSRDLQ